MKGFLWISWLFDLDRVGENAYIMVPLYLLTALISIIVAVKELRGNRECLLQSILVLLIYVCGIRLFDLEETRTTGEINTAMMIMGLVGSMLVMFCAVSLNLLYFPRTCLNWFFSIVMTIYAFYGAMYFLDAHFPE